MNQEYKQHSHCGFCGTRFTEQLLWPRKCFRCYNDSFKNPLPVVVIMQPVIGWYETGGVQYGILIQQRGINPKKGEWALTGGYIDDRETWQEAAVRETKEEIGLPSLESHYKLWDVVSSTNKDTMLIFCTNEMYLKDVESLNFQPNHEVLALDVMWKPQELAFPAHTEHANRFLEILKRKE